MYTATRQGIVPQVSAYLRVSSAMPLSTSHTSATSVFILTLDILAGEITWGLVLLDKLLKDDRGKTGWESLASHPPALSRGEVPSL